MCPCKISPFCASSLLPQAEPITFHAPTPDPKSRCYFFANRKKPCASNANVLPPLLHTPPKSFTDEPNTKRLRNDNEAITMYQLLLSQPSILTADFGGSEDPFATGCASALVPFVASAAFIRIL